MNEATYRKKAKKKYNLPVIGHFADKTVRFNSILEAERITLIFEACIGKLYKAGGVFWEFEKGNHYIKYKAYYIRALEKQLEEGNKNQY